MSATQTAQHDAPQFTKVEAALLAAFIGLLITPLGAIVAFAIGWAVSQKKTTSKQVLYGAVGMVAVFLVVALIHGPLAVTTHAYFAPLHNMFAKGHPTWGTTVQRWVFHQPLTQLMLGAVGGWVVSKVLKNAEYVLDDEEEDEVTWWHRRKFKKTANLIAADQNGPMHGATLGVDKYGNRVELTDEQAGAHGLICGASGSGKTQSMLIEIRDQIRRGQGVCFVDLKGSIDVPEQLAEWAQRYGRRFLHWSITDPRVGYQGPADGPAFWDPIFRGDPSRKKDLIIASFKWDAEYYKEIANNYIQEALTIAALVPDTDTDSFTELGHLMEPRNLIDRCRALFLAVDKKPTPDGVWQPGDQSQAFATQWWKHLDTIANDEIANVLTGAARACTELGKEDAERSAISGLGKRIGSLARSTAGTWLRRDPSGERDINLLDAVNSGDVIVFSLDSSKYAEVCKQIGGLVIQDLVTLASELRHLDNQKPFRVYVDEFSAIGNDNINQLLSRARDAKVSVKLSTQALADLRKADPEFDDQVLGIVNYFEIHRANHYLDAEMFAGLTGQHDVRKENAIIQTGKVGKLRIGGETGSSTITFEREYQVLPNVFQELRAGEMVFVAMSPTKSIVNPVFVIRENHGVPTTPTRQATPAPEREATARTFTPIPLSQINVNQPTTRAPAGAPLDIPDLSFDGSDPMQELATNIEPDLDPLATGLGVKTDTTTTLPTLPVLIDPAAFRGNLPTRAPEPTPPTVPLPTGLPTSLTNIADRDFPPSIPAADSPFSGADTDWAVGSEDT